jgi:hypothetical protein
MSSAAELPGVVLKTKCYLAPIVRGTTPWKVGTRWKVGIRELVGCSSYSLSDRGLLQALAQRMPQYFKMLAQR